MAAQNLPSFPSAGFPQLINSLMASEIRRVDRIIGLCAYDEDCRRRATVSSLETEESYCHEHFLEVERGF